MRHLCKRHRLNRPQDQRKALLRSLATSLFTYGEITTTLPKAKALKIYAERIITKAKNDNVHSRRIVSKQIYDNLTNSLMCVDCKKVLSQDDLKEGKCEACGGKVVAETVLRKLFNTIAKEYAERNGGYTRIYHLPPRRGDAAKMALIQLVQIIMDKQFLLKNISNGNIHSIFKYAVLLEYDGTAYGGSQFQPNARTIQQELETALKTILRQKIKTVFSGRTDAKVSALGQVVHFETTTKLDIYRTTYALNALLPSDIAIRYLQQVDNSFHARKSATKRWYRFTIHNHGQKTALNRKALHVHKPLDENLMHQALQLILGTNEFDSFKSSNSSNPSSNCTVHAAQCTREGDYIYIDIIASRFVYNMVRILTGTLLETGKKSKPVTHLKTVLEAHDREQAGKTVKPEGLTLMAVEYPKEYNLFKDDKYLTISDFLNQNFMEAKNEDVYCKAS